MQNGEAIPAEEAGEWLRQHFKDDPAPRVDITFRNEEPDLVAYRRVLEILFCPRTDTSTT
ncbi:hypothetical protein ABZ922_36010 [Streptomyces shenzhenensis]|uniref:hypothetical protein n=1 Tax=Streptomyces shenzhenensis TaxID=943815 RepID=UPI00340A42C6